MTTLGLRRLGAMRWAAVLALAVLAASFAPEARAQYKRPARQVTVFAIIATPHSMKVDPKLSSIAPQLKKLLPNHGFKLLDVKTKRLQRGQAVSCDLGGGRSAAAMLIEPLDDDGKVELRCELLMNDVSQLATQVATPPNQLFFCDKALGGGERLLIGVGAR